MESENSNQSNKLIILIEEIVIILFLLFFILLFFIDFKIWNINEIEKIHNKFFFIFFFSLIFMKNFNYYLIDNTLDRINSLINNNLLYLYFLITNIFTINICNKFHQIPIQNNLSFQYSYFIGILLIVNFTSIICNFINNDKKLIKENQNYKYTKKYTNKLIYSSAIGIIIISIYTLLLISIIKLLNLPLPEGIINYMFYSNKILLFSIANLFLNILFINILIENKKYIKIITTIRIITYPILTILIFYFYSIKGLLFLFSILEIFYFIINIIYKAIENKKVLNQ